MRKRKKKKRKWKRKRESERCQSRGTKGRDGVVRDLFCTLRRSIGVAGERERSVTYREREGKRDEGSFFSQLYQIEAFSLLAL